MDRWITIWAQAHADMSMLCKKKRDCTARITLPAQLGGKKLRLRLSNQEGKINAILSAVSVRVADSAFLPVSFSGSRKLTLNPGQECLSDELSLPVKAGDPITVSLAFEGPATSGNNLPEDICVSKKGNYTESADIPVSKPGLMMRLFHVTDTLPILSAVEVCSEETPRVIVCFGDSITQMSFWTKPLAEKLKANSGNTVVINKGIAGNQLLSDPMVSAMSMYGTAAIKRFRRDVLELSGTTDVIFALGVNDLNMAKDENALKSIGARGIMDGLLDLNRQARGVGLRTYIATVTPCGGTRGYRPFTNPVREELNRLIRKSTEFDGILDYDAAIRDTQDPSRLAKPYDSGDHLHPGPIGGQKLSEEAYRILK